MNTCVIDESDIEITQGNNYPPIEWIFKVSENPDVLFDLTGSTFKLRIYWPGETLNVDSNADPALAIDIPTSIVSWSYTTAQSRLLPLGRIARYELERWIAATQQSVISGYVAVSPGANPD